MKKKQFFFIIRHDNFENTNLFHNCYTKSKLFRVSKQVHMAPIKLKQLCKSEFRFYFSFIVRGTKSTDRAISRLKNMPSVRVHNKTGAVHNASIWNISFRVRMHAANTHLEVYLARKKKTFCSSTPMRKEAAKCELICGVHCDICKCLPQVKPFIFNENWLRFPG